MEIKKEMIIFLFLLVFLVGVVAVVSAAITTIDLTSPVGGEDWGGTHDITWTSNGVGSDKVNIYWKISGGNPDLIATKLATTGTHSWDTDLVDDGDYSILIEDWSTGLVFDSSGTFTVDNIPPTVNAGADKNSITGFTQSGTASDNNLDSVQWTKVSGPGIVSFGTPNSESTTVSADTDGSYVLRLTATDLAGNSAFDEMTLNWDSTPPAIDSYTLDGEAANAFFNPNAPDGIEIFITATEPIEFNRIKVLDSTLTEVKFFNQIGIFQTTTTKSWDGTGQTGDGMYTLQVNIEDEAGNIVNSLDLTPHTITVDTQNPTISALSNPVTDTVYKTGGTITITFTPTDPAPGTPLTCGYKIGSGGIFVSLGSCTSGIVFDGIISESDLTDGRNDIFGVVMDSAGNTAETLSVSIVFDNDNTLSVPSDFTTIQSAIDAGNPGDTISVATGTYTGDLSIPTGKDNLVLAGADKTTTIIKGVSNVPVASWPLAVPNIDIRADGVKIRGFTVEGPNYEAGKYSSGIVIEGSNVEIYDNNFKTPPGNDVNGDEVSQAIQTYHKNAIPGVDVSNLNIHDNTFTSLVSGSWGYEGIYVNLDEGAGSITIKNNQFSGDLLRAVTSERSNTLITNNTIITDLVPVASDFSTAGAYIGIYVGSAGATQTNVNVTENIVKGSISGKGFLYGIRVGSSTQVDLISIRVTSNTVEGNEKGIYIKNNADGIIVNSNFISGNTIGVQNDDIISTLNAERNWWGDLDPSDQVSANVDFTPFAEDTSLTRFYAPVLNAVGDKSINEGSTLTITLGATDADVGDILTYSDNVAFGSLVGNVFTWSPTGLNQGANLVTFTVSDGFIEVSELITITVNNVAPVVDAGTDQIADEGSLVSFSGSATDAGGDGLTYSWDFDSSNGITEEATGQNPIHTHVDEGVFIVTLTVNDGTTTSIDTLTVTVNNVAPTITLVEANTTGVVIGESIALNATATDVGTLDVLTYSWDFDSSDGIQVDATGISTTHSYSSGGTYTVTLTVTDDDGGIDTEILTITVNGLIWSLDSSWNLVSVPKTLIDPSVSVLGGASIWEYNGISWINPITIEPGVGYWADNAGNAEVGFDYSGDCVGPLCLPSGKINIDALESGWNLIGLTSTEIMNVSSAFSSMIFPEESLPVFYVINYNEGADAFEFLEAVDIMNPGEGYWVYVVK